MDIVTGSNLVHAILSALIRKRRTGKGAKVDVSLMESIIDFQFEGLTTYLNVDSSAPERSKIANAHAYLGAPYGIYATATVSLPLLWAILLFSLTPLVWNSLSNMGPIIAIT
ncbi:probable racemase [Vibrio variabilis]|uniref:Probable racemase n=1 Tax=Vibrio variabilis TaxID=990271 RepID=A0ABQ0JHN5_9VIBR|nr:probable racemase [Vibrio variabilis]